MAVPAHRGATASGRVVKPPAFMFERPLVGGRLAECMPSLENMQPHLALQVIQVFLEHAWREREAKAKGQAFERTMIMPIELLDDAHVRILLNDEKTFNFLSEVIMGLRVKIQQTREEQTQQQLRGKTGRLSIRRVTQAGDQAQEARKAGEAIEKLEGDAKIIEEVREQFTTLLAENLELVRELRLSVIAFWMARHNEALVTIRTLDRTEHGDDEVVLGSIESEASYVFEPPVDAKKTVKETLRLGKESFEAKLPLSFFEPPQEYAHALEIPFYLNGSKAGELEVKSRQPVDPEPLIMLGNLFAETGARLDVEGKFTEILRSKTHSEEQKMNWICAWFERMREVKMSFSTGEKEAGREKGIIVPVILPSGTRGSLVISKGTKASEQVLHEIGNRLGEAGIQSDLSIAQQTYEEAASLIQNKDLLDANTFGRAYNDAYQNSTQTGASLSGMRISFKCEGNTTEFHERVVEALLAIRKITKQAKQAQQKSAGAGEIEDLFAGVDLEVSGNEPLIMKHEPMGVTHATADQVFAGVLLFTDLEGAREAARLIAEHWKANARKLLGQATVYIQPLQLYPPGTVGTQNTKIEGETIVLSPKKK
ncbi:hypothetical protein HY992_00360 [Candidatus Micrarchaeota archaeon]|nr:hypothetical protein [Candidatus Micrarchaeota archaeon]